MKRGFFVLAIVNPIIFVYLQQLKIKIVLTMRKSILHFMQCAFLCTSYALHAQVSNPSTWESFINSEDNPTVCDTFRIQTFGKSEKDNWDFTLTGSSSVVQDKYTLKLPVGSGAIFQPYSLSAYTDVKIKIHVAGLHLSSKDSLLLYVFRNGEDEKLTAHTPTEEDYLNYKYFTIGNNPNSLSFVTTQTTSEATGYYMTDSVFAYGNIPTYSLFTGTGIWTDSTRWSHLPPLRNRSALINGTVSITEDTQCHDIAIYSGSLQIGSSSQLSINNLDLYGDEANVLSNGEINISNRITVHKTFESTDKWYFISFPFDVYLSGIDSQFEQKDDTPNDGGNYFYVQTYNGDKRATENQSSENWEVVPIHTDTNTPLFEKNRGYLIALDKNATQKTLSFSSQPGEVTEDFAQKGILSITLENNSTSTNQENYGWYLCGNPLPAPLALSRIKSNAALDGYVYVYNGSSYQPYAIGSNHALPPFSAFFVKASSSTTLQIMEENTTKNAVSVIDTHHPLNITTEEPHTKQNVHIETPEKEIRYAIKDKQLYLQNIPTPGNIKLFNLLGECVWQKVIQAGTQTIPVTTEPGIYILQIQTKNSEERHKLIF